MFKRRYISAMVILSLVLSLITQRYSPVKIKADYNKFKFRSKSTKTTEGVWTKDTFADKDAWANYKRDKGLNHKMKSPVVSMVPIVLKLKGKDNNNSDDKAKAQSTGSTNKSTGKNKGKSGKTKPKKKFRFTPYTDKKYVFTKDEKGKVTYKEVKTKKLAISSAYEYALVSNKFLPKDKQLYDISLTTPPVYFSLGDNPGITSYVQNIDPINSKSPKLYTAYKKNIVKYFDTSAVDDGLFGNFKDKQVDDESLKNRNNIMYALFQDTDYFTEWSTSTMSSVYREFMTNKEKKSDLREMVINFFSTPEQYKYYYNLLTYKSNDVRLLTAGDSPVPHVSDAGVVGSCLILAMLAGYTALIEGPSSTNESFRQTVETWINGGGNVEDSSTIITIKFQLEELIYGDNDSFKIRPNYRLDNFDVKYIDPSNLKGANKHDNFELVKKEKETKYVARPYKVINIEKNYTKNFINLIKDPKVNWDSLMDPEDVIHGFGAVYNEERLSLFSVLENRYDARNSTTTIGFDPFFIAGKTDDKELIKKEGDKHIFTSKDYISFKQGFSPLAEQYYKYKLYWRTTSRRNPRSEFIGLMHILTQMKMLELNKLYIRIRIQSITDAPGSKQLRIKKGVVKLPSGVNENEVTQVIHEVSDSKRSHGLKTLVQDYVIGIPIKYDENIDNEPILNDLGLENLDRMDYPTYYDNSKNNIDQDKYEEFKEEYLNIFTHLDLTNFKAIFYNTGSVGANNNSNIPPQYAKDDRFEFTLESVNKLEGGKSYFYNRSWRAWLLPSIGADGYTNVDFLSKLSTLSQSTKVSESICANVLSANMETSNGIGVRSDSYNDSSFDHGAKTIETLDNTNRKVIKEKMNDVFKAGLEHRVALMSAQVLPKHGTKYFNKMKEKLGLPGKIEGLYENGNIKPKYNKLAPYGAWYVEEAFRSNGSTTGRYEHVEIGKKYYYTNRFVQSRIQQVDSDITVPNIPEEQDNEYNNVGYESEQPYYAEIKQGMPGNEEFEAMAGVPTTRDLFFSVGATEFKVRVKGEVKKATTNRKYKLTATGTAHWGVKGSCSSDKDGNCTGCETIPKSSVHNASTSITVPIEYSYFDLTDIELWRLTSMGFTPVTDFTVSNKTRTIGTGAWVFDQKDAEEGNGRIVFNTYNKLSFNHSENKSGLSSRKGYKNATCDSDAGTQDEAEADIKEKLVKAVQSLHKGLQDLSGICISDSIVIKTSEGYQTLMYYQTKSNTVSLSTLGNTISVDNLHTTVENVPTLKFEEVTVDKAWKNNPKSSAKWKINSIVRHGYTGDYSNISGKYTNNNKTEYVKQNNDLVDGFRNAGATPSTLKIVGETTATKDNHVLAPIDIKNSQVNGEVNTGVAFCIYERVYNTKNGNILPNTDRNTIFNVSGSGIDRVNNIPYRLGAQKLNNIVVHDPVSTLFTTVIPNPKYFDQRVTDQTTNTDLEYAPMRSDGSIDYDVIASRANSISPIFINLDREFKVHFPYRGDFAEQPSLQGIPEVTGIRGKGYTNGMNIKEWNRQRHVILPVHAICLENNKLYLKGSTVDLNEISRDLETFNFYCVLANNEEASARIEWDAIANNSPNNYIDNDQADNKERYALAAKHNAYRVSFTDVVGNIGAMSISDTEDFRFSNLFKKPKEGNRWLIKNLVKDVYPNKPNGIVADHLDVRRMRVGPSTDYLNTYGKEPVKDGSNAIYPLPLVPRYNPIKELQNQTLRIGYKIFADLETIGNYYGENIDIKRNVLTNKTTNQQVQIRPIYFAYNRNTKKYKPIDIYYRNNGSLVQGYSFNNIRKPVQKYHYYNEINKIGDRINVFKEDLDYNKLITDYHIGSSGIQSRSVTNKTMIGTMQSIHLIDKHRLFVGDDETYSNGKNPDGAINSMDYAKHAQRWVFNIGLPSSAVFVEADKQATKENIEAITNKSHLIVCALDVLAKGEVWTLRYIKDVDNSFQLIPNGFEYPPLPPPYNNIPIITIYQAHKSSKDDIIERGTH